MGIKLRLSPGSGYEYIHVLLCSADGAFVVAFHDVRKKKIFDLK